MMMFMRPRPADAPAPGHTPPFTRAVVVTAAIAILVLGIFPTSAIRWAEKSGLVAQRVLVPGAGLPPLPPRPPATR